MCTRIFRRFSPSDTRGISGFHSHNESFDIFDEGTNGVFLPIAPREAYWLTHELRSAKYQAETKTQTVPWECTASFAYGVKVRVDEDRRVRLTDSQGSIAFAITEVDLLIEFINAAITAYLEIEPPMNQSGRLTADDTAFSIRIVGNYYPDGVPGDGVGALAAHVWLRTTAFTYGTFLSYVYPTHYFELASWLESVAVGESQEKFEIGGFMAAQMVFDVVGESSRRRLRIGTCYIRPEECDHFPHDDLSFETYPYLEFPVATADLRSLALSIREQVRLFQHSFGADAELGAAADGGA